MAGYYNEITGEYITEDDDTYTGGGPGFQQLDDTSGTGTIGDYTRTQRFDDGSTLIMDLDGNIIGSTPATDTGYTGGGGGFDIGNLLSRLGTSAFNALKGAFTDSKGDVNWRNVAAAAGGLYGLYQSNRPQDKVGYQGGIPKYEAVREAAPGTYDPDRRPGSGGQRYFSQMKYAAPGEAAEAARVAAKEEAAGLEALNRANPARQARIDPTAEAAKKGEESSNVREGRPASDVIQDKPVPQYATGGITALAQGRYLGGATDGMADKIPARIDGKQEARLSHGEFVIPADVVSHLGNGNSEAGAQRLYSMMDRLRKARTGTAKQGKQVNPDKFMPA
jgi:hypothetical protein